MSENKREDEKIQADVKTGTLTAQTESSEPIASENGVSTASAESTPKKHSNLFVRCMSVVVLLPLLLALMLWGGVTAWAIFMALAAFVGMLEYMRITNQAEHPVTRVVSACLAMLPPVTAYLFLGQNAPFLGTASLFIFGGSVALTLWGTFLFTCFRPREISRASGVINATLGAVLYVGVTFLFLALLKRDFDNANAWLLTLMAMTWGSDTGAYFVGRKFGRHKLAPILSPKKSVEGAIGGFMSAILAAVVAKYLAFPDISLWQIILLAVVANFLAQMGDLSESLIKRSHKIKDSGNIIPGHGGILDRVDALLFSAPWVYGFAYLIQVL